MGKALLQAGHRDAQPGGESLEQAVTVRLAGQDRRDSYFERAPRPWHGQAGALGHQGAEHRVAAERGDPGGVIALDAEQQPDPVRQMDQALPVGQVNAQQDRAS